VVLQPSSPRSLASMVDELSCWRACEAPWPRLPLPPSASSMPESGILVAPSLPSARCSLARLLQRRATLLGFPLCMRAEHRQPPCCLPIHGRCSPDLVPWCCARAAGWSSASSLSTGFTRTELCGLAFSVLVTAPLSRLNLVSSVPPTVDLVVKHERFTFSPLHRHLLSKRKILGRFGGKEKKAHISLARCSK
jgi:hypothetical protein